MCLHVQACAFLGSQQLGVQQALAFSQACKSNICCLRTYHAVSQACCNTRMCCPSAAGTGGVYNILRAALLGGGQQRSHHANVAAAEGVSVLQQGAEAAHWIHEQHASAAPQPEPKPQARRSW